MYHCHIRFCLLGSPCETFALLRELTPSEHFTHDFTASDALDPTLAAEADVVVANLSGTDGADAAQLADALRENAQLILLAEREQVPQLTGCLEQVAELWTLPMSGEEIRFRLLRWQQSYKLSRDLWERSQFLDATINSIPSLIWYKTRDGIHEKVNDSFCETVGKTREQVQGRGHAYIWDVEQDDPACIESERVVMTEERTLVSDETVQAGDGLKLLTTYKSPLYDLDGSVMGTVGVGLDVTREQAYKQELIQKNQMLEMIFTTMDCGVLCHTVDGSRILSVNQAALRVLGYESGDELLADGFHMIAPSVEDEDKAKLLECISTLQKVGDTVATEYRIRHKDGKMLYVMGSIKLMEKDGELFYQRFLLDVTAQRLQEQQERTRAEQRQMELVHALSIDYNLVCVFDLDTGLGRTLRNSTCEPGVLQRVFGQDLDLRECMEQYIGTCVHPDDRDALRQTCDREHLIATLEQKNQFYLNYRTICNGEVKYFQVKGVRTGNWEQRRATVLGFRNVDDETREEMKKKGALEDALSQANRANRAKSIFLSNMSHDIRTPMNAIVGFTTLAITHINRQDLVEEYLKKILTSGNHLVSLINDVLDMSRIESGKMHLEETQCSLPDILHGLRSIVQADIRAKQLEFYIDAVDVLDDNIYCDKLRLNQVLLNLLSNCIKYTGAGGTVTMRIIEQRGAPSGYANYEFHIKDTGIGMSEEFVTHIFEPFEREKNSTISGIQGTGLGMAITKNIVDMMNGTIEVHSQQGVGTEFILSLTFRLHSEPKELQIIPKLQGCRALVVDDDFNTCDSVTYMLQQMGMRAEWTLSGREAVLRTRQAIARDDNYCVYIIDWLMPDMNGIEVARRIRSETGDDVPIIVLSAYDWADIEEEARQAGVSGFCSKPLFLSELRTCLNNVVSADEPAELEPIHLPTTLHSGRILLAEDNELNQEIATAILEEAGFTLEVAENGQVAVDMLRRSEPGYYSLILMDVQMPVMDGYSATRAIRALEDRALASIPILAMTANAFEEDRQQALLAGMNGHVAKPININALFQAVEDILK